MSSGKKIGALEEEKRKFDLDLEDIEKRISSKMGKDEEGVVKRKDDDDKTGYELMEQQLELELAECSLMSKTERKKEFIQNMHQLQEKKVRNWMVKRGKGYLLDFQDSQIKKLKECFTSLDGEESGEIGIEQLEEPLIGLGFADTRDEVQEIIDTVDLDGSGKIEFPEFLSIIKNQDGGEKASKINKFFKDMTSGTLASNDLSFNLIVQKLRREYLMDAIMSGDPERRQFGERILRNVGKQVQAQKFKNRPNNYNND